MKKPTVIKATWPAPANVCAYTTTKSLGNLGLNQNPMLLSNREKLKSKLNLPDDPIWIQQVHGNTVVNLDDTSLASLPTADGSYTTRSNHPCVILTGDCLPIAICSSAGDEIAALHAGWRSLLGGVIENGIQHFKTAPNDLMVWLGPAISAQFFIVGDEIYHLFIKKDKNLKSAFIKLTPKHFHCNLYELAKKHLQALGIHRIFHDHYCTYKDKSLFYSYRREDKLAGRMATLIWRQA
jgi:YfiH family protein